MNIDVFKRLNNKPFYVFIAGLTYKILQDCGVVVPPEQWEFYINAIWALLMFLGIVVDTSTSGISDKTEV
jgi:uncharacterized membrane protein